MKTCLIISGGEFSPLPNYIQYEYVIACDKGYENALKLGIKPDFVIGDFDSYKVNPKEAFGDLPVSIHPVMKDDTDTMLAVKEAISKGYTHIIICCALGGRMDHTLANIQSMSYIAKNNVYAELISSSEYMAILNGPCTKSFEKEEDRSFSLFALSDICNGVSISGSHYDVKDITLESSFPLGFGNSWKENKITVCIKTGILLVVMSDMSHEKTNSISK